MKRETMSGILEGLDSAAREGEIFTFREGADATAFVGTGGGLLTIPKVQRIELGADHVQLETSREERYFFGYAEVVGIKVEGAGMAGGGRGAGFR